MTENIRGFKYKFGLFLLFFGHVILLLGLIAPFFGASIATSGFIVISGEGISVISIILLGKSGFIAIKTKVSNFTKQTYVTEISRTRFYIGISFFIYSMVNNFVFFLYSSDIYHITNINNDVVDIADKKAY